MSRPRRFAFLFVCQSGDLEIEALLLAASLRGRVRCPHELIACVPGPEERFGRLDERTVRLLTRWGVRIVPIRNEVAPDYPIGNKVSCLRVATDADKLVFLDSDVLCVADLEDGPWFDLPFGAKPADVPSFAEIRPWKRAYAALGLEMPAARVAASVSGDLIPPYFNAGFIAVDRSAGLGDAWLDACRKIDRRWGIPGKRPHLDQIALPVAVRKLGLPWLALDERWNYPANRRPVEPSRPAVLVHYHRAAIARREPVLADLVRRLCADEPDLATILGARPEWAPVLREPKRATAPGAPPHDLVITGIPRSGTSYLCNLIHRWSNCVVLNEPDEIGHPLRYEPTPWTVSTFFRDVRRNVAEGKPVRNKLKDGKVTDETVGANELVEYRPEVETDDFVLGVKNPLAFLSRLADLRRAMPHARVAVCVRNPFDTIASWKQSFEHLEKVDLGAMRAGGLRQQHIETRCKRELQRIAEVPSAAVRRAAWWRYLAERALEATSGPGAALLVRYQDVVADPRGTLDPYLAGLPLGRLREPIEPSSARQSKRSGLDADDVQAIRALCREPAEALGVWEDLT